MKQFMNQAIAAIISLVSKVRLKRAIALVLASFFVLTSTACSSTSATRPGTKSLIDQTERNLGNSANNPQDLLDNIQNRNPLGEKARETARNTKRATTGAANDLSQGAKYGSRNLQENLSKAAQTAPDIASEAARTAKGAAQDASQGVRDLGRGAKNIVERAAEEAS